jgi:hypothetical protein
MADKKTEAPPAQAQPEVMFTCQVCHQTWGIRDMRQVFRFRPVLVVCPECEKAIR